MKYLKINGCDECLHNIRNLLNGRHHCSIAQKAILMDVDIPDWCPLEDAEKGVCANCKHWRNGEVMSITHSSQYCEETNMHTYCNMSCTNYKPIEVVE